jgi:hypothetical protein
MTEPRKRPRRNTLQAASIGSLDIRDALLRGSQVPSTPSDVTNDQEAALVAWVVNLEDSDGHVEGLSQRC